MKKSSPVWKFFERVIIDDRCTAVLCKLCENQYKFFGNTTNLRVHLINKHPIQWELSQSGNLDDSAIQNQNVDIKEPRRARRKKYAGTVARNNSIENVEVMKLHIDSDQDDESTTINMVRQMHGDENSAEEWLEEDHSLVGHFESFEPKPKRRRVKYRKIKREIQSPTDLPEMYTTSKPDKLIYEEPQPKDEYSIFGDYIANKLRKIKVPRTRGNIQQLITTLLWQAEYGMYDSAEAVKRVLMISMTPEEPELTPSTSRIEYEQDPTTEKIVNEDTEQ